MRVDEGAPCEEMCESSKKYAYTHSPVRGTVASCVEKGKAPPCTESPIPDTENIFYVEDGIFSLREIVSIHYMS